MNENKHIEKFNQPEEERILSPENGIIAVPQQEMSLEQVIEQAEKRVDLLEKVMKIAVKRTNSLDWVDQNGKPYLCGSGAEKIMPVFGISMRNPSFEKTFSTDDQGQYYMYIYQGIFSWQGGEIVAVGTCTSRDKFFAWDSQAKEYKPLSKVDESNVMKSAYTNMIGNGVTRLLGIRNLTWDQVKNMGIDSSKVAKVDYNKGSQGAQTAKPTEAERELRFEIREMLLEITEGNTSKAQNILEQETAFKGRDGNIVSGVRNIDYLKGKRLQIAHGKIKKRWEEYQNITGAMEDAFGEEETQEKGGEE